MTTFTITISDKPSLIGLRKARENYNASLPTTTNDKGEVIPNEGVIASDGDYMQWIAVNALLSYARQFNTDTAEIDAKITALQAKKAEILAADAVIVGVK